MWPWSIHRSRWNNDIQRTGYLFFYVADEDGNALSLGRDMFDIHESSLLAIGSRADIGGWQLHLKGMVIWQWSAMIFHSRQ